MSCGAASVLKKNKIKKPAHLYLFIHLNDQERISVKRLIILFFIFALTSSLQANTDTYEKACYHRQHLDAQEREISNLRRRKNKGAKLTDAEQVQLKLYWQSLIAQAHHAPNLKTQ